MKPGQRIAVAGAFCRDGTNQVVEIKSVGGPRGVVLTCPIHGGEWDFLQEDVAAEAQHQMIVFKTTPQCPRCAAEDDESHKRQADAYMRDNYGIGPAAELDDPDRR